MDTGTLHVVDFIQPTIPPATYTTSAPMGIPHPVPRWIGAMSDGSLLTVAGVPGISGGDLLRHTPSNNLATNVGAPPSNYVFTDGTVTSSRDGSIAAAWGSNGIGIFSPGSNSPFGVIKPTTQSTGDMALSPDGSLLLVGGRYLYSTTSLALKTDLQASAPAGTMETPSSDYDGAAFSPDGSKIYVLTGLPQNSSATAEMNRVIAVYSTSSGQLLGYVPVPSGTAQTLTFQPYGALAAIYAGHVVVSTSQLQGGDGFCEPGISGTGRESAVDEPAREPDADVRQLERDSGITKRADGADSHLQRGSAAERRFTSDRRWRRRRSCRVHN